MVCLAPCRQDVADGVAHFDEGGFVYVPKTEAQPQAFGPIWCVGIGLDIL